MLGDATGHGIAPALSVTQMQAMLRMAFRLGADLETAFMEVNNQLADTLAGDRFITAFVGMLDATRRTRCASTAAGRDRSCISRRRPAPARATSRPAFRSGAMRLSALRPPVTLEMQPGDILVLLSDGIYEYDDAGGEQFGEARVEDIVRAHHGAVDGRTCRRSCCRRSRRSLPARRRTTT